MPDSDQKVEAGVEEAAKQQQIRGFGSKTSRAIAKALTDYDSVM